MSVDSLTDHHVTHEWSQKRIVQDDYYFWEICKLHSEELCCETEEACNATYTQKPGNMTLDVHRWYLVEVENRCHHYDSDKRAQVQDLKDCDIAHFEEQFYCTNQ